MLPPGLDKITLMKLLHSGHYIMTSRVVTAAVVSDAAIASVITDLKLNHQQQTQEIIKGELHEREILLFYI